MAAQSELDALLGELRALNRNVSALATEAHRLRQEIARDDLDDPSTEPLSPWARELDAWMSKGTKTLITDIRAAVKHMRSMIDNSERDIAAARTYLSHGKSPARIESENASARTQQPRGDY